MGKEFVAAAGHRLRPAVDSSATQEEPTEPIRLASRLGLVVLCLVAAFAYRGSVSLIPTGIWEDAFLLGLSALFLVIAVLARRTQSLGKYWEIPFAFFVFTIAGFAGDVNISPLQRGFITGVLHQSATSNDPLASSVLGTVLVQVFSTVCIVVPIIALTKASGRDLSSIFICKPKNQIGLIVGVIGFIAFYVLAARGRTAAFFPNSGVSFSHFLALTPALLVLVLCNGLREELWFRGLFLKKYGRFLGRWSSNVLAAVIFTSFHVQVQYALHILPFLGFTLILGLVFGYLMQKSGSLLGPAILHAGSDIPIFLAYLSYVS
jgi:membrane protease YdiL (CAAX protease family)